MRSEDTLRSSCVSVLMAMAIASVGCNKPASGSAGAKQEDSCTYKHENPKFCFSPPAGFAAKPEQTLDAMRITRLQFAAADKNITLEWGSKGKDEYERVQKSFADNERSSTTDEPNGFSSDKQVPGGFGGGPRHLIHVFRKGPAGAVSCSSNAAEADAPSILAACKTLKVD